MISPQNRVEEGSQVNGEGNQETRLFFIKKFVVLRDQQGRAVQKVLRIVTPIILRADLTIAQGRDNIEMDFLLLKEGLNEDYQMVFELPCRAYDGDSYDLIDADRNNIN